MENNKNYPPTVFLSVFPTKEKKNDKSPDFNISAKVGDKFVTCGAGWKKTGEKGMYLSLSVELDVMKKLIIEKSNSLPSSGLPMPFADEPKDPFEL